MAASGVASLLLGACAGYDEPDFPEAAPEPPAPVRDVGQPPVGSLWRHEVVQAVDAGLGRFLQKVRVEAALDAGRFTGFRILALQPATFWESVDLQPGDVVIEVNGLPIQRDTEAYAAFESLKQADQLSVSVLRSGQPRQLSYHIVAKPGVPAASESPTVPSSPAAPPASRVVPARSPSGDAPQE